MPPCIPIHQVDAFTAEPFRGNPAAVCLLQTAPSPAWMQAVAAEMNLSETAFVLPEPGGFHLRWFTPAVEVPLCGHATLASAHILWQEQQVAADAVIHFRTQSGQLTARAESGWICLDFPAYAAEPLATPAGLAEALGAVPTGVYRSRLRYLLVELDSAEQVRQLRPTFSGLQAAGAGTCIVTARADTPACDFVSRFFAPEVGINEDPVTGSAHCVLGPFWAQRLERSELTAHQVSARGGVLRVRVHKDRVDLLGQAVTVLRGNIYG